ncbi:hypothetical protein MUP29_02510 [bacterium]|nr:hypothetical protein [bacterium]
MDASISKTVFGVFVAAAVLLGGQLAAAMSMEEACGDASGSMAPYSQGRWLPWSPDTLYQEGLDTALIDAQRKQLTEMAEPFMRLDALNPPRGVEARPHRVIGARQSMGEPMAGSELMIQIFHPTYKQAGTASASIKLSVNKLSPLFYGIGGGEIKDEMGAMFLKPIYVGELGGAPVYWSGRPRDCIVVYKAHERPLWKPVSQERYLLAQIQLMEHKIEDARSDFMAGRNAKAAKSNGSMDMAQQEELIRQMQAINPEAAKDMEKQFAAMRAKMKKESPGIQSEADREFDRMGKPLYTEIDKFKAELNAMTPTDRAAQGYLGGTSGSKVTLLSRPDDSGARPIIAPATDYFSKQPHQSNIQLLMIEFKSAADHPPETIINVRLRKELNWRQFWQFVGKQ